MILPKKRRLGLGLNWSVSGKTGLRGFDPKSLDEIGYPNEISPKLPCSVLIFHFIKFSLGKVPMQGCPRTYLCTTEKSHAACGTWGDWNTAKRLHNHLKDCRFTMWAGERLNFLLTWSLISFIDLSDVVRCKPSTNLAGWAKLVAIFGAGTADLMASCSKRRKYRARRESHSRVTCTSWWLCFAGVTCGCAFPEPLLCR